MARRSPKSPVPVVCEKYEAGCMCTRDLYRLFAFRQGRSYRKVLSDGRHSNSHAIGQENLRSRIDLHTKFNERSQGLDVKVDNKVQTVHSEKTSLKMLMEEEMPFKRPINKKTATLKVKHSQRDSKLVDSSTINHGKAGKTHQSSCHIPLHLRKDAGNTEHCQLCHKDVMDISFDKLKSSASTKVFCKEGRHKKRMSCGCKGVSCVDYDQVKDINLRPVKMTEVEETGYQKFIDGKYLHRDGASQQSKQLLDALEILRSNKELFIELLQDPNSLLGKHIQDSLNSQAKGQLINSLSGAKLSEYLTCNARHCEESTSPKRLKSGDRDLPKENADPQPSERIVVLRPGPTSLQNSPDRLSPYFSQQYPHSLRITEQSVRPALFFFRHIKRKLKDALGISRKEQHQKPINGKLEKSPDDCQCSECSGKRRGNEIAGSNLQGIVHDIGGMAKSSLDVKKADETQEQGLLPTFSPGSDWELGFDTEQMRFSPLSNHKIVYENRCKFQKENKNSCSNSLKEEIESLPSAVNKESNDPVPVLETTPNMSENHFMDLEVNEEDISHMGETKAFYVLCQSHGTRQPGLNPSPEAANMSAEIEHLELSRVNSCPGSQPSKCSAEVSSSSPSSCERAEDSDSLNNKAEQPSQLTGFEQVFTEDVASPASTIYEPAELPLEGLQVSIEDHSSGSPESPSLDPKANVTTAMDEPVSFSEYIGAVLRISGLTWDKLSMKSHSAEQLLDQSLFYETKMSNDEDCGEFLLLFHCISEVLAEACQNTSGCAPYVLYIKPLIQPLSLEKTVTHEVIRRVDQYLLSQLSPQTLKQLVEHDLARSRTWLDICSETEDITMETAEGFLEELVMEVVLDLLL